MMQDVFNLMQFETPIVEIPDENNSIYIKRDDLIPFSFGGNKVRVALEFIEDMKQQGKNCIVGYGDIRSNLNRALANLCSKFKIPCYIISPADDDGTKIDSYNSKMVLSCGAKIHYCKRDNIKENVENILEELKKEGFNPYYIYGESAGKGNEHIPLRAYVKVYEEIKNQYDYIFLATGTGITQGGLLIGKSLHNGTESVIGISILRTSDKETEIIRASLESFSKKIRSIGECEIQVVDEYLCGGYGFYNSEIERTICKQLACNGIPFDPIYTGKAFWGMQDYLKKNDIREKKILFIHTGGTPIFFDYMNGLHLCEVSHKEDIIEAIRLLEEGFRTSLVESNIDINDFSEKICNYGKLWCHYDMGRPVSVIAGYFNDFVSYTAYLSMMIINPAYRGKNLEASLLTEFEQYAQQNQMEYVKLEVRKYDEVMQRLYKKFGYEVIGDASETSFYMGKTLEKIGEKGKRYLNFLMKVDKLFPIPLSQKENLTVLASKFEKYGTVSCIKENGEIVALCAGYANDLEKRLGYISIVAVLPEYTNKGYGKIVVQEFLEKAKNMGMKAVHLYADRGNQTALRMYNKLEFVDYYVEKEQRVMDKHLIRWLEKDF